MRDYTEWLNTFSDIEDDAKAAVAAVDDLGRLNQRARDLLLPILKEAFVMHRRDRARSVERTVPLSRVFSGDSTLEQRKQRLESTFPLPDGRRVSWSEATISDHQDRVAYLRRHIAGVESTVSLHEDAIARIVAAGVSCLVEIEVAA